MVARGAGALGSNVLVVVSVAGGLAGGDVAEEAAKARRSGSGVLVMVRGAAAAAGSLLADVDGSGVH